MGIGAGLYMYDVVVKSSRLLFHLLMSSCLFALKGLRLLWEVTGVSAGSVSSCIELLRQGHVLAVAPGSCFAQLSAVLSFIGFIYYLAWLSVWSGVQMICIWSSGCHCQPIITCSGKSRMVYLSGDGLPRLSWKKHCISYMLSS